MLEEGSLKTQKYSPFWSKLNSDKLLLFAVEKRKKHHLFLEIKNLSISTVILPHIDNHLADLSSTIWFSFYLCVLTLLGLFWA